MYGTFFQTYVFTFSEHQSVQMMIYVNKVLSLTEI